MAMCAMASVLSGVDEDEEGVSDSALDSGVWAWAGSTAGIIFFSVPSRWPALMNCMGMNRKFLPASYAAVRWRASSLSENLDGVTAETVNKPVLTGALRKERKRTLLADLP